MLKRDKVLIGITIGAAVIDAGLAWSTYAKKKGVVLKDMVLTALDEKMHKNDGCYDEEGVKIPIE